MASPVGAPTHIAGAATTNISCSVLTRLVVNTPATGNITLSDGTPGTTIAIVNSGAGAQPFYLEFGISLATGNLRVVSAAAQDITVVTS